MPLAVQFDTYGSVDVLQVREVPRPVPAPDEVLVEVLATSINPGEAKIRGGDLHAMWPATFPEGEGSDLAGRVAELGSEVTGFEVGQQVVGFSDRRSSHAQLVTVPAGQLAALPAGVGMDAAGSLYVAGATAVGVLRAVALAAGDTLVVSAAAGGVGALTVQLAVAAGARVIGIAGPGNHDWLRGLGVEPVSHGAGIREAIVALAPNGVDAFVDLYGGEYPQLAVDLGVAKERIDTIVDFGAPARLGVKAVGMAGSATIEVVAELADKVAGGSLTVPVAATFPLTRVREAFTLLATGHTRGKIVLHPQESD